MQGCWFVIGRLGNELEGQFGITSEVAFLFSPYADFQRRSFNALTERARNEIAEHQRAVFGTERFTPDPTLAFVVSKDKRAANKVADWNGAGANSFVVAVDDLRQPAASVREGLAKGIATVLEERDLYRGRNPVTGNNFFGRSDMLRQISTEIRQGRSLGLFGLRRSGKTSVVREYQRRSRDTSEIVVLSDMESMSSLDELSHQIGEDVNDALRKRKESGRSVFIGNESEQVVNSPGELSQRLRRIADRNSDIRLVVALDEVESLAVPTKADPEGTRAFLGSLRKAAQTTNNISLLFTGVTTRFFSISKLSEDIDNPLFGFVDALHLRPFEPADSVNLIKSLGKKMLLNWTDEAAATVHDEAGGFPFLLRDLASRVRHAVLERRTEPLQVLEIHQSDVELVRDRWAEESAVLWDEIGRTLKTYHPIMGELLQASESEIPEWLALGTEAHADARSLEELGLLDKTPAGYARTEALIALQGLGRQPTATVDDVQSRISATATLQELAASGESESLEFKSTARWNLHTKGVDKRIEHAVARTVAAFLNNRGGVLLIGVDDTGDILGLDVDLEIYGGSLDRFENWLLGSLLGTQCGTDLVARLIDISFPDVQEQTVCRLDVRESTEPVWIKDQDGREAFFVRVGNSTRELEGREQLDYIKARW